MFKRLLPTALTGYVLLVIVNWGCTKLDTTTLGNDLIPVVDNVHTFADTLDIVTTQGIFDDTFKISRSESNVLGRISADPLFGETNAEMYFHPKPAFFPYYLGNANDSIIKVDSVVLCLAFTGHWGDSTVPQHLEVYKIDDTSFADSSQILRTIKDRPSTAPGLLGSADILINKLKDTVRIRKDSVVNQIRIKLSDAYAQEIFERDSITGSSKNAFISDSIFRKFDRGFAVKSTSGNALMYISLTDAKTRLEVHIKKRNRTTNVVDTVFNSFTINVNAQTSNRVSASSNYFQRNYAGTNVTSPPSSQLYLATGPGTYATLRVPELDNMSNKIVHRAEIYIEQDPDLVNVNKDSVFSPPVYMYLDLVDTGTTVKFKPLYYDLSPNEPYDPDYIRPGYPYFPLTSGIDFSYFGGFTRTRFNYLGEKVVYYTLNVTRHVQQILTKDGAINYTMRLFPGYSVYYPQFPLSSSIDLSNPLGYGRIRLKSGTYPDPKRKMRMVIIYSKI